MPGRRAAVVRGPWSAILLALAVLALPASAQTARLTVLADSVSAGMPFEVAVAVPHGPGRQVTFPAIPSAEDRVLLLGDAEALSVHRLPPAVRGAIRVDSAVYRVVVFTADSARVGPVEALVAPGDTATTASVVVPVRSVLVGETEPYEPAPVGPAQDFPSATPLWIALGVLGVLIVGGVIWGLVSAFRRPEPRVVVTPYQAATRALDALDAEAPSADAGPEAIETHVVAVRDVLRAFLADRLGLAAREATTVEIVSGLAADTRVSAPAVEAVRQALRPTDLVAFARVRPAPQEVGRLRGATRAAVEAVEAGLRGREGSDPTGESREPALLTPRSST